MHIEHNPKKDTHRFYKNLAVYEANEIYMRLTLPQQIEARDVLGGPVNDPATGEHFENFLDALNAASQSSLEDLNSYFDRLSNPVAADTPAQ